MSKPNLWLLIISVIVGPLIGSVAFMIGTTVFDWLYAGGGGGAVRFLGDYWPIILSAGYGLGFLPAILFALAMAFLSRRIPKKAGRIWVASLIGAGISGVCIGLFLTSGFAGMTDSLYILVAVVITGAIVGVLCMAIIEWLQPLPAPASAVP